MELEIACSVLDGLLEVELSLPGDIEGGEQVGYEAQEDGVVVRHDLGQVEVAKGPHQHLVLGTLRVASLQSASHHQHRLDGTEAPIVMVLQVANSFLCLS